MTKSEWIIRRPAPHLRPYVDRYIGYRLRGFPPGIHRGLPSGRMTFIVSIGPLIDVASQVDPSRSPGSYGCVVGGLHARPALITHDGDQEGVTIDLTPSGCRALFGMPVGALWGSSVECSDVAGAAGRELWERMQTAVTWNDRFAVCDDVLTRLAIGEGAGEISVTPELLEAWRMLARSGGTVAVEAVAHEVGWSRQHLARRFDAEFGLGPKLAARIIRFGRARRMMLATPPFIGLAQVAAACGYFDQAHLNRDFAELAGCPPTTWLAEELPSFQDATAAAV